MKKAQRRTGALRYAAYLRCSTDDQAHGDFTTIDAQRQVTGEYIARHIREQGGGEMLSPYQDDGRTGTNLKRPGWNQLLADAQAGKIDVIVCTFMSRLARGKAYIVAEHLLLEAGVKIEMVQEKFGDDLAGYMGQSATIMMDGMYPKVVSAHVKMKQQAMVANGYFCGSRLPLGYKTVPVSHIAVKDGQEPPRRLVPSDDAPIALAAFELFVRSRSLSETRAYLKDAAPGFCLWHLDSVRTMLTNEMYRGIMVWGPHRNGASHEAIIPPELWDAVQAIFAGIDTTARGEGYAKTDPAKDKTPYYLRGMVHCQHCGCRMTPYFVIGRNGETTGYYECIRNQTGRPGLDGTPCPIKRVNAGALHREILIEIQRAGQHPTRLARFIRMAARLLPADASLKEEADTLRAKIRDAEKRLARLV